MLYQVLYQKSLKKPDRSCSRSSPPRIPYLYIKVKKGSGISHWRKTCTLILNKDFWGKTVFKRQSVNAWIFKCHIVLSLLTHRISKMRERWKHLLVSSVITLSCHVTKNWACPIQNICCSNQTVLGLCEHSILCAARVNVLEFLLYRQGFKQLKNSFSVVRHGLTSARCFNLPIFKKHLVDALI